MDSANGILTVMTQAGLEPSADTYTTLMCGFAKKGDIATINQLMEECEQKEIYLLDKDFLDIIYSLAVNGHKEHVPEVLEKTRRAIGYSQDAINLILRLINKGQEEVAYLVLKTIPRGSRTDGTTIPLGNFFIKQMVKADRPIEKIIEYCELLEADKLYENGLSLATETSLKLAKDKLCYKLLDELKKRGQQIRQHFFWPLIMAKAHEKNEDGILEVLLEMRKHLPLISFETMRDYVLPNLSGKSSEIIGKLRTANISVATASSSLAIILLQKNDMEEAAIICSHASAFYSPELFRKPLTNAFYKTKDVKSYVRIVRMIFENLHRQELLDEKENWDKHEVSTRAIFLTNVFLSN